MREDALRLGAEKNDYVCKQASTKFYFHHHPIGLPSPKNNKKVIRHRKSERSVKSV